MASNNDIYLQTQVVQVMLQDCYSRKDIIKFLVDNYNLNETTAVKRYKLALDLYIKSPEFDEFKKVNIGRLDSIIKRAFDEKKYSDAIRAIDTLNKMVGSYEPQEVNLTTNLIIF